MLTTFLACLAAYLVGSFVEVVAFAPFRRRAYRGVAQELLAEGLAEKVAQQASRQIDDKPAQERGMWS